MRKIRGIIALDLDGTLLDFIKAEYAAIKKCFEDEEFYNNLKKNCEEMREKIIEVGAYCDILLEKYQTIINKR